jgi:hypothetical protein
MGAQQSIYLHEKGEAGGARELGSHKLVERETRLGKAVQLGQLRLKPKAANQQAATVLLHALIARENRKRPRRMAIQNSRISAEFPSQNSHDNGISALIEELARILPTDLLCRWATLSNSDTQKAAEIHGTCVLSTAVRECCSSNAFSVRADSSKYRILLAASVAASSLAVRRWSRRSD